MGKPPLRDILRRRSPREWIVFFILLSIFTIAGHVLSGGELWISLRSQIYQIVSSLGRPARYPQRTAVVLLDDEDYWSDAELPPDAAIPAPRDTNQPPAQLAGRIPTNRAYLAHLVDQLDAANVGLIALDFDLRSPRPGTPEFEEFAPETRVLTNALQRACSHGRQIILASELVSEDNRLVLAHNVYDDLKLPGSCVHTGYIQLPRDIRKVPTTIPLGGDRAWQPFALAAVDAVDHAAYKEVADQKETDFPYSQFISEKTFRETSTPKALFSGHDILFAKSLELAPQLLNRVVLVGADWHTLALYQGPYVDRHLSPDGPLAGVLLQANYIEAALQHGTFKPFPELLGEAFEVVLVLLLSVFGMLELHWAWKWSAVAASALVVLVFSYLFLQTFGLFLDFFFPLIFVGLHSLYEHVEEWRHEGKHHHTGQHGQPHAE